MAKPTIKVGKRYYRWVVIKRVKNSKQGATQWLCCCDCGNKRIVAGSSLRSGHSKSCGCLRNERTSRRNTVDRTGQRYGRLTVIERQGSSGEGRAKWLCKCDCGKTKTVIGKSLQAGVQSCGCLKRDANALPKGEAAFNQLLIRMKIDAKRRGYKWKLTKNNVKHFTKQPCYYCGREPMQVYCTKANNGTYIYNGIDRLDNNIGYLLENVVSCCMQCNYAKRLMSVSEFRDWIQRIYKYFITKEKK